MKKSTWKKMLGVLLLIILGIFGGIGGKVDQFEKPEE